ncbi:hypothetical protein Hanom_Chr06g00563641 [Helianthus anomalus]
MFCQRGEYSETVKDEPETAAAYTRVGVGDGEGWNQGRGRRGRRHNSVVVRGGMQRPPSFDCQTPLTHTGGFQNRRHRHLHLNRGERNG